MNTLSSLNTGDVNRKQSILIDLVVLNESPGNEIEIGVHM